MAARVKAAVDAVTPAQDSTGMAMDVYRMAIYTAMCTGIITEIVDNSELVPVTKDSGTAGAGIITGTVK